MFQAFRDRAADRELARAACWDLARWNQDLVLGPTLVQGVDRDRDQQGMNAATKITVVIAMEMGEDTAESTAGLSPSISQKPTSTSFKMCCRRCARCCG